jgi:hypothetical protein
MDKSCAKCGQMFGCSSPTPQCWCNEVSVDNARWADRLKTFPGCLCQDYLALFKVGAVDYPKPGAALGVTGQNHIARPTVPHTLS